METRFWSVHREGVTTKNVTLGLFNPHCTIVNWESPGVRGSHLPKTSLAKMSQRTGRINPVHHSPNSTLEQPWDSVPGVAPVLDSKPKQVSVLLN